MSKEEVILKLKEILVEVAELDVDAKDLDETDKNLFEDYHFNSILALEYLLRVEEEFDIEIDDEDLDSHLLNDLVYLAEYVQEQCGEGKW